MTRMSTILFALLMSMGLAMSASAQEGQAMPGEADISDSELELFVEVQEDIQEITTEYSARLEGVEDPDDAAQLQQEASQMMVEAVEEIGLDVATYNNIAVAIESDEELRDRVQSMLN